MARYAYIIIVAVFLVSCEDEQPEDVGPPAVKITKPANGLVFSAPVDVDIEAKLGETHMVIKESLLVTKENAANDTVLYFKDNEYSSEYELNKSFTCQPNTKYKILVIGESKHDYIQKDSVFVKGY